MFNRNRAHASNRATRRDVKRGYRSSRSFADLLPWVEYLEDDRQFLFNDGVSRMAVFGVEPIPTEGRDQSALDEVADDVANLISESFPEEHTDAWTVQLFLSSESVLDEHTAQVSCAMSAHAHTAYTKHFVESYAAHIDNATRAGGLFIDRSVTGSSWGGKSVRIRICIYRRYWQSRPRKDPQYELEDVIDRFTTALDGAGLQFDRLDGRAFHDWMALWFNPAPSQFAGDASAMLRASSYPEPTERAFAHDLAESVLLNAPVADEHTGYWYFDDLPHAVVIGGKLKRRPLHGSLSGEIRHAERVYALTDKLPEHSVVALTLYVVPQDTIKNRISLISSRAIGESAESGITRRETSRVLEKQAIGDKLYPMEIAVFINARDENQLTKHIAAVKSRLNNLGIQTLDPDKDPIALDNYIKNLPGVPVESIDRHARQRARIAFASHIASLAPLYGRSRGTAHPGILFWNRSGEPQMFDPLNAADRRKNAHLVMFGPSGAGKSATLISMLRSQLALHRPKIYIIEAGNSFGLFGEHAKTLGLSVHQMSLKYGSEIAIPPFADVVKLAEREHHLDVESALSSALKPGDELLEEGVDEDDEERDILGEVELIAMLMITGGEKREIDRMTRSNRMIIRRAILDCAEKAYQQSSTQRSVLPMDIAKALHAISTDAAFADSARDIREMGDSMMMFCDGLNGRLFNRDGQLWPESDITIIDLAQAAQKGNEDTLAVAYTSLMQHINAEVERNQMSNRNTIVLTDEAHLILKNPLLMPYIVSVTKMWRKLGAWYWLGTQNFDDFPDTGKALLNLMEWWLCLTMPAAEIEQIARFRTLTPEQESMMRSTTKAPGLYTEGVLLSNTMQTQFRVVPPPIAIALAQTEKHEKARRQAMMDKEGITELEAAEKIAELIALYSPQTD